jgi:hypothetical protein
MLFLALVKAADTEKCWRDHLTCTCGAKIVRIFAKSLWNGEMTMAEWISVNDRLPTVHENVLVWDSTIKEVEVASMTMCNEWFGVMACDTVTHWMPLPEPPKEGK